MNLDEALEIAQQDYSSVKDIYAADILAWCLFRKGRLNEAKNDDNRGDAAKDPRCKDLLSCGHDRACVIQQKRRQTPDSECFVAKFRFDIVQAKYARNALNEMKRRS
jgi:hypothetical protein